MANEIGRITGKGKPAPISKPGQGMQAFEIDGKKFVVFGNSDEIKATDALKVGEVVFYTFKEGNPNPILTMIEKANPVASANLIEKRKQEGTLGGIKMGEPTNSDLIVRQNALGHATELMCTLIKEKKTADEACLKDMVKAVKSMAAEYEEWVHRPLGE